MKLIPCLLAAGAVAALATGCSSDEPMGGPLSPNTFTVQLPEQISSRVFADGKTATALVAVAYDVTDANSSVEADRQWATFTNLKTQVTFNLAHGRKYDIVFFAADPTVAQGVTETGTVTDPAYVFNDGTVEVNYANMTSYSDNYDAFCTTVSGVNGGSTPTDVVTLRRPFAQLNVGTSDLDVKSVEVVYGNPATVYTSVAVSGVAKALNLRTNQTTADTTTATFVKYPNPQGETFPIKNSDTYSYLSMNYLLLETSLESSLHNVRLGFDNSATSTTNNSTLSIVGVPFQANYRTNIFGNLLSGTVTYNVEIDPDFYVPSYDHAVGDTIKVSTYADLQAAMSKLSGQFQGGTNTTTIKGGVIVLQNDIAAPLDGLTDGQTIPKAQYDAMMLPTIHSPLTIDLNKHELQFPAMLVAGGDPELTIMNGSLKSGFVWANNSSCISIEYGGSAGAQMAGKRVTLENVEMNVSKPIYAAPGDGGDLYNMYAIGCRDGYHAAVEIIDSKVTTQTSSGIFRNRANDRHNLDNPEQLGGNGGILDITVDGSTLTATRNCLTSRTSGKIMLRNSTFNGDVCPVYIKSGHAVIDNCIINCNTDSDFKWSGNEKDMWNYTDKTLWDCEDNWSYIYCGIRVGHRCNEKILITQGTEGCGHHAPYDCTILGNTKINLLGANAYKTAAIFATAGILSPITVTYPAANDYSSVGAGVYWLLTQNALDANAQQGAHNYVTINGNVYKQAGHMTNGVVTLDN